MTLPSLGTWTPPYSAETGIRLRKMLIDCERIIKAKPRRRKVCRHSKKQLKITHTSTMGPPIVMMNILKRSVGSVAKIVAPPKGRGQHSTEQPKERKEKSGSFSSGWPMI